MGWSEKYWEDVESELQQLVTESEPTSEDETPGRSGTGQPSETAEKGRLRTAHRPTRAELQAAAENTVPDVIAPGLVVLFVGINPGLYSAAVGHHFARPGNRFWPALYEAGFTPRLLRPEEDGELPVWGLGITNLVSRTTAAASELSADELRRGKSILEDKVARYSPKWTAFVGIGAYFTAFGRQKASLGPQQEGIGGSRVWLLPNTSGLNAHYTPTRLAELLRELRVAACENAV